jgi:alpha-methylacyl-CoA racemase
VVVLTDVPIRSEHLLALSGNLVTFGQKAEMFFPNYLVEFVASNGIAIKCLQKLLDKSTSIEQLSVLDLVKYFGAFNVSAKENGMINSKRGDNILEGGAPYYAVYTCKEGHLAVGNLEPKFYHEMIRGLNLT